MALHALYSLSNSVSFSVRFLLKSFPVPTCTCVRNESLCTSGSHRWLGSPQRRLRLAIHCAHNRNEMYPFDSFSLFSRSSSHRLEELLLSIEWDVRSRPFARRLYSLSLCLCFSLDRWKRPCRDSPRAVCGGHVPRHVTSCFLARR